MPRSLALYLSFLLPSRLRKRMAALFPLSLPAACCASAAGACAVACCRGAVPAAATAVAAASSSTFPLPSESSEAAESGMEALLRASRSVATLVCCRGSPGSNCPGCGGGAGGRPPHGAASAPSDDRAVPELATLRTECVDVRLSPPCCGKCCWSSATLLLLPTECSCEGLREGVLGGVPLGCCAACCCLQGQGRHTESRSWSLAL